jgi:excisionase family DNA binding protein
MRLTNMRSEVVARHSARDGTRLLTVGEAAAATGVSPATLWRWARRGRVRAVRVGGRTFFALAESPRLVVERRETSRS